MPQQGVEDLKAAACAEIDRRADEIVAISDHIMRHPETGYREERTAYYVSGAFRRMGLTPRNGLARTGVKARMPGKPGGPTVAVMGELDSLLVGDHPLADPSTGAAHACGHHAMIASMLGVGYGLGPLMQELTGDLVMFAVPAEEGIELDWRMGLREEGQIEFLAGKPELVRLGEFDDVDIAMITHTADDQVPWAASVGASTVGTTAKRVRFAGRAAHAAAYPWEGANALKAATLAMTAMDFQRETFRDEDSVRVHWIVSKGGEAVNAVPADVHLDVTVRAGTVPAMLDADAKVDRALQAGAMAMGCAVTIENVAGMMPLHNDSNLTSLVHDNLLSLFGKQAVGGPTLSAAATDVGDLGLIMPVIQPLTTGVVGTPHTNTYRVVDHVRAAVDPAKFMAMTVIDLLSGEAAGARRVLAAAKDRLIGRDALIELRRSLDKRTSWTA